MMHFKCLKVFSKYDQQMFTPALKLLLNAVCVMFFHNATYMTYKSFGKSPLLDFHTWATGDCRLKAV